MTRDSPSPASRTNSDQPGVPGYSLKQEVVGRDTPDTTSFVLTTPETGSDQGRQYSNNEELQPITY